MEMTRIDDQQQVRPSWHRPQVMRLTVAGATSVYQVLKNGSTEDFFTHAPDWPTGAPIT